MIKRRYAAQAFYQVTVYQIMIDQAMVYLIDIGQNRWRLE
ncbi:Uncharacterised protein [Yersinia intermedia]|uniref:Uncharacterized protein n=1 Tax=Yersinia intermedia TaxID=631 RepID=A0A0H5LUF0_YERIN|nr:Uncharacterised protein [Yersinia intermedia]